MNKLKVGDIVFYKGDEGIIREVMTDGKENFYRVDVSRKSILYLCEDELDLVTQKLNDNQKVVLEWLKNEFKSSIMINPIAVVFSLHAELVKDSEIDAVEAYVELDFEEEIEVLAAFAQWGLEQEEAE
ncbi:hypothetical protein FMV57_RS11510 [Enterococcus hirae]